MKKNLHKIGSFYIVTGLFSSKNKSIAILAQTEYGKVSLINLKTGNRLNEAIAVKNLLKITQEEFERTVEDNYIKKFCPTFKVERIAKKEIGKYL